MLVSCGFFYVTYILYVILPGEYCKSEHSVLSFYCNTAKGEMVNMGQVPQNTD